MGNDTVIMDAAAAEALRRYADSREGAEDCLLRIGVIGGGCSGFQYRLGLDNKVGEDDLVFDSEGERIVIASEALPFLAGATVTYVDSFEASGFQVNNPNVVAACGCGSSFQVECPVAAG